MGPSAWRDCAGNYANCKVLLYFSDKITIAALFLLFYDRDNSFGGTEINIFVFLQVQQPPSLMSLNNTFGNTLRYSGGSGGNFGNDRFRRDDRRTDNFRVRGMSQLLGLDTLQVARRKKK